MLPAAFIGPDSIFSGAGGIAAAIAIGGFCGQVFAIAKGGSDDQRRRLTAVGGFAGLVVMIGLILVSINAS